MTSFNFTLEQFSKVVCKPPKIQPHTNLSHENNDYNIKNYEKKNQMELLDSNVLQSLDVLIWADGFRKKNPQVI